MAPKQKGRMRLLIDTETRYLSFDSIPSFFFSPDLNLSEYHDAIRCYLYEQWVRSVFDITDSLRRIVNY